MVNTRDSEAFVTISNRDIYEKIELMHNDIKKTNGQVRIHKKLIGIIYGWMVIVTVGFIRFITSR